MKICTQIYSKFNNDNRQIPVISQFMKHLQYNFLIILIYHITHFFCIVLSSMYAGINLFKEIYGNN